MLRMRSVSSAVFTASARKAECAGPRASPSARGVKAIVMRRPGSPLGRATAVGGVGGGVLPLRTVIKLAGRTMLPMPRSVASGFTTALWLTQLAEAPPSFFDYLQYICVADGALARKELGFEPLYTSREALIDYANAQHLRDVRLLSETPA